MKQKKEKVYFSITKELYDEFMKHVDDKLLDKSKVIEALIEKYMLDVKYKK